MGTYVVDMRVAVQNFPDCSKSQRIQCASPLTHTSISLDTHTSVRKVTTLEGIVMGMKNEMTSLHSNHNQLKEHVIRLENQSRRDNLILEGIHENPDPRTESDDDCYRKVCNALVNKLQIMNVGNIAISRCHRLGHYVTGQTNPRGIIFKLHWYGDRNMIWGRRKLLKNSGLWLSENYAAEVEKRRQILTPILKAAWAQKKRAVLIVDKLLCEGKTYTVNNLHTLPEDLNPQLIATPTKNGITAFSNKASPMSNFFAVNVKDPATGIVYHSSEQMYQHKKAMHHDDDLASTEIMKSKNAYEAYKAGKKVKTEDSDWHTMQHAKEIMYKCCLEKFGQNPELRAFLAKTGITTIAEARKDLRWGTGCTMKDAELYDDPTKWLGTNWLGECLLRVRDDIR
jgi:ribA/ribD-fused uncharacterized protein